MNLVWLSLTTSSNRRCTTILDAKFHEGSTLYASSAYLTYCSFMMHSLHTAGAEQTGTQHFGWGSKVGVAHFTFLFSKISNILEFRKQNR